MAANIAHHEICMKRGVSVRDQIVAEECIINICFLQWELKILACDFPLDVFFFLFFFEISLCGWAHRYDGIVTSGETYKVSYILEEAFMEENQGEESCRLL